MGVRSAPPTTHAPIQTAMASAEKHVFMRRGDARSEVDRLLAELKRGHGPDADPGFHKYMYVAKADSTVVMVESAASPLAHLLRGRPGWTEPGVRGGA